MRRFAVHPAGLAATFLVVLLGCACTSDRDVILDLGTLRPLFVDSSVMPQSTVDPDVRQFATWNVKSVTVFLENQGRDLALGENETCRFDETSLDPPRAIGKCERGLIVGSTTDPKPLVVEAKFTLTVARAEPVDLTNPMEDSDADGLANPNDNCPLVPNPDQEDSNQDGFGNLCSIGTIPDTDGDGLSDLLDNCIWVPNPDQADTNPLTASGNRDGIGDACTQQAAVVGDPTENVISVTLSQYVQPQAVTTLVLDFSNAIVNCSWSQTGLGTCLLDDSAVKVCLGGSSCPDPV